MEKTITCADCKQEFVLKKTGRYKRKYCAKCSKQRKKDYDNLYRVKFEDTVDEDEE